MEMKDILSKCENIEDEIIEYRRKFHKNPELKYQEKKTSQFVKKELDNMGIEVKEDLLSIEDIKEELKSVGEEDLENVQDTSVLGVLKGENNEKEGKTVLLRADMDALPVTESEDPDHIPNKQGFRSEKDGLMHACGHDAHTAMLLGAAKILSQMKDELQGEVRFIFQPAEEGGNGAKLLTDAELLADVNAIFGIHVESDLESGIVKINDGPMNSSVDRIKLKVTGGGGHASAPHETTDPIPVSTDIINSLYKMINREIDTQKPSVLTITKINSGRTWNVIPDEVNMEGTIRTFDEEIRKKILQRTEEIGKSLADTYGLEFNLITNHLGPASINSKKEAELFRSVARDLFNEEKVTQGQPSMGSEDFAYYLERIPGAFAFFGAGEEKNTTYGPHHNPKFDIDESVLYKGTALYVGAAIEFLER